MGKFTVIPQSTFDDLQLDAGVLLRNFDPETGAEPADEDIICATTGGINASCVAEYSDMGEDIDNVPGDMMELKHLDRWTCTLGFTSLGTSPAMIRMSLGAADIDSNDPTKIIPRADLKQTDFGDLWWVGDKADGGYVAVQLKNALSTGGFVLQTTKNGKGQVTCTMTGHVSMAQQKVMPMVFYSTNVDEEEVTYTYTSVTPVGTENPSEEGWYVLVGDSYRTTNDTTVDSNVTYYEATASSNA